MHNFIKNYSNIASGEFFGNPETFHYASAVFHIDGLMGSSFASSMYVSMP
jgi:hypothetical protein